MDPPHSESFRPSVCMSSSIEGQSSSVLTSSNEGQSSSVLTSSNEGQSSSDDCRCYLEQIILRKDFSHLANLLHAAIWQRFSLVADEHVCVGISPEDDAGQVKKHELQMSMSFYQPCIDHLLGKENIVCVSGECSCNTPYKTGNTVDDIRLLNLKYDLDTVACDDLPVKELSGAAASNVLLSSWFLMSAVFTGCPKLLNFLLLFCEENILRESNRNSQVRSTTAQEDCHVIAREEQGEKELKYVSQSVYGTIITYDSGSKSLQLVDTNTESIHTNLQSVHTNLQSIHTNLQSVHTNMDPARGNLQLVYTSIDPAVTNFQSVHTNMDPTVTNFQSVHTNMDPAVTNLQSVDTNMDPTVTNLQTAHANLDPAVTNLQSVDTNMDPTVTNLQSVHTNIDPAVTNLQSVDTNMDPTVTNLQTVHANLDPTVTNLQTVHINLDPACSADDKSCQMPSPSPQTLYQFVNRKIPCEFPITDTWIHQSVNLMMSPLHLACWRHDLSSIVTLLQHGADPNELALEQTPDELIHADTPHSNLKPNSLFRFCDGLYFYENKGLSPLHFIALGLRSPPRHSILEGCKAGIIHDTCAIFQKVKTSECYDEMWPSRSSHLKDYSRIDCVWLKPDQRNLEQKYEMIAKSELVVNCFEVLLQAGANPNIGQNVVLKGAYPLDIVLQPPIKVYYAPSAARSNQSSVSLRLQDLEHSASYVAAACETLLRHDAQFSILFISAYSWRPQLLDCFHLHDSLNSQRLVSFLIRLQVFSDRFLHLDTRTSNLPEPGTACSISVTTSIIIHRFISDVINMSVPTSLIHLVLNWCSVAFLHDIIRTITKIAEMSVWNNRLRELSDIAISLQLRSLKHSCFRVILSAVQYSYSAIFSLPLPTRLKRELTYLYL